MINQHFDGVFLLTNIVPGRRTALLSKEEEPKPFDRRAVLEADREAEANEAAAREGVGQYVTVGMALTVQNAADSKGRSIVAYFVVSIA